MVRLGLFLYDHLGGRKTLPGTATVRLDRSTLGNGLKPQAGLAFMFSDCRVDDSRLVVLTALDAAERGARILTRTRLIEAERDRDAWVAQIEQADTRQSVRARALVNAAGPWVSELLDRVHGAASSGGVRLVKGSHIVVPKLYEGEHAFMLQNPDRRIVFAIPYEGDFTLIGTTDRDYEGDPAKVKATTEEIEYLCKSVSEYLAKPVTPADVVWSYAGVRPLYDDGASDAKAATRDYVFELDTPGGAPLLSIYGGKITTYRRLAEEALERLAPYLNSAKAKEGWTATAPLPGGDMDVSAVVALTAELVRDHPFLAHEHANRLAHAYGTRATKVLGHAKSAADLGQSFGATLSEAEVRYLMANEWAVSAEDVVWRRSKLGLRLSPPEIKALDDWMAAHRSAGERLLREAGGRP